MTALRDRRDRCPGALRPWSAEDGLLVRLRLIGGQVSHRSLLALTSLAQEYGDGRVHPTSRANLQLRGLPGADGRLTDDALAALEATGLLPTRSHELVRNVMVSPQTGLAGGRVDLRPLAADLDRRLCADPMLAELPGRFLLVLDDGRGDLRDRGCDLGLVVLDATRAQLRIGEDWGPVVPLADAATILVALAGTFLAARGHGTDAPWHVAELTAPLLHPAAKPHPADPALPAPIPRLAHGVVPGGRHVAVPDTGLDRAAVESLEADHLVVTPWRGVLVPTGAPRA